MNEPGTATDAAACVTPEIRPFSLGDSDQLLQAVLESVNELGRWYEWCHAGLTPAEVEVYILERATLSTTDADYTYGLFDRRTNRLLGAAWLNRIDRPAATAYIGYWVRRSAAGHGVATNAARTLAARAAGHHGFQHLRLLIAEDNGASHRVAAKLGATVIGTQPAAFRVAGVVHDALIYDLPIQNT